PGHLVRGGHAAAQIRQTADLLRAGERSAGAARAAVVARRSAVIEFRNSDIATYLECRRKWQFSYLQSLEKARDPSTPTPNLSLGSIFHRAHEAFWTGGDAQDALSACEAKIAAALPEGTPLSAEWLDELHMARAMVRHYEAWL